MLAFGAVRWGPMAFLALVLPLAAFLVAGAREVNGAAEETTVADLIIWAFPTGDRVGAWPGNCIEIGAGTLNVTVGLAGGADVGPIEFFFSGYGGRDPGSKIETVVNRNESAYSLNLSGGIYCYSVWNRAFIDPNAAPTTITDLGQSIRLRMTLSS